MKKVRIEAVLLLPKELSSSDVVAVIAEALESLPGNERVKIRQLRFDPG